MEYRPEADRPVDAVWVAHVKTLRLPARAGAPSIHSLDATAELDPVADAVTAAALPEVRLAFDSRSGLPLAEGRRFVLALAQGRCVALFAVNEEEGGARIVVASKPPRPLAEVARALIGHTVRAFTGETVEIGPAADWIPDPER
jgi:hypothetical protein